MSAADNKAVFLSYASQDAEAAGRIADALRAAGVVVWFDQNELVGGDAWDAKIRAQIGACALFVPVISAATQVRLEGYFRLEWKLAAQRTHAMAETKPFLLPVVIDDTRDAAAQVPAEFRAVQWTWLPGGERAEQFCSRMRKLLASAEPTARSSPPDDSASAHPREHANAGTFRPRGSAGRRVFMRVTVAGLVVAAGITLWKFRPAGADAIPPAKTSIAPIALRSPASDSETAVVILPFVNRSADPAQEYFSDGLTEAIITAVGQEGGLRVVPRTSAFSFKGKSTPLADIARELNVARVVEGSVQRSGNRVRILCTVTRIADQFTEPLTPIDREMVDIFSLQDEVAKAVVRKLGGRVAATGVAVGTTNAAAYDWYLRGRSFAAQTSLSWPQAVDAFQRAVELDPQFALAWASLGRVAAAVYATGVDSRGLEIGDAAALRALELDPNLAEARLARSNLLRARFAPMSEVERELALAEQREPGSPEVLSTRAHVVLVRGRYNEACDWFKKTLAVDPRNGRELTAYGHALVQAGRYAEADEAYRQAFQIVGSSIPLTNRARVGWESSGDAARLKRDLDDVPLPMRGDRYWAVRATQLFAARDFAGSLEAAALMPERADFFRVRDFFTAQARGAMGNLAGARKDYMAALPIVQKSCEDYAHVPAPFVTLALIYAALDRGEEAFAALQKATEIGRPQDYVWEAIGGLTPGLLKAQARVHVRFGDKAEALKIVEAQAKSGAWRRTYLLNHPDWDELRKDARFRELAERAPL